MRDDTIASVSGDQQYKLMHLHTAHPTLSGLNSKNLLPQIRCSEPKWLTVSPRLIDRGFMNLARWSKINSVDQTLSSLRPTLPSELCPHNTMSKPHQPHRQIKTCSCILLPLQCNMCVSGELSLSLFDVCGVIPKQRLCKTLKQHRDRQSERSPCWKNHTHRETCQQVHLITISCLQMFGILWQMESQMFQWIRRT